MADQAWIQMRYRALCPITLLVSAVGSGSRFVEGLASVGWSSAAAPGAVCDHTCCRRPMFCVARLLIRSPRRRGRAALVELRGRARLIPNSSFVGCCTGRSAGLSPFKIRPTYWAPACRAHGTSCACARRFESESVERDEPRAVRLRPEVSPRKDERDGNAPHPTP
jgi:hypothetical protein